MKKTFLLLIILLSLCISMAAPVHAADIEPISGELPAGGDLVIDETSLLSDTEWQKLNDRASALTSKYQCEIRILIIPDMWVSDAKEHAISVYKGSDFGYGAERSGIMMMLSMADRDYALIAHGYGNTVLTDHGRDVILNDYMLPLLKNNYYYEAFIVYLDKIEEFLMMAQAGTPFDVDTDEAYLAQQAESARAAKIVFNILIPLLVALIVCLIFRSQMKTARKQRAAANYIPDGGFVLTGSSDTYLYSTEVRRTIEDSSSSGGTTTSGGFSGSSGKF